MSNQWIESALIDGFRNIRNLRLEGLGNLNVLVGENNSGKTSVLEALSVLAHFDDPIEWVIMVGRRDFGRLDETRAQSIRWCFDRGRTPRAVVTPFEGVCEMSCTGRLLNGKLRASCHDIISAPPYQRGSQDVPPESEVDVPEVRRGIVLSHTIDGKIGGTLFEVSDAEPPSIAIWDDDRFVPDPHRSRRPQRIYTETLNPYSYQINRLQVRRWSAGALRHSKATILDLLQVFDPEIQDIDLFSTRGGRPSIYLAHRRLGISPLSIFGDALRRAVLLATTILSFDEGGILFIDEIETGIHVHAIRRVFSWLARIAMSRSVQVFVTTHSLEAIDAILFGTPDAQHEVVAFHLDQRTGQTTAKRFDGDLLTRLRRDRGIDVR